MPRSWLARTGWPGGEWSPRLIGRFDLDQHSRALQVLENAIPLPQGAVIRRPPTCWHAVLPASTNARVIPFVVDSETAYIVVIRTDGARAFNLQDGTETFWMYSYTNIDQIAYAQTGDVLYLVNPNWPPIKFTRTAVNTFTTTPVTFLNGRAPLAPLNLDSSKFVSSITGTWPSLTITMNTATFIAADNGRAFFVRDTVNKRAIYTTITSVISPTQVNVTGNYQIGGPALPATPQADWALGLFSSTKGCNAICFHESRLWYGGFAEEPDLVVSSVSNSFDNFETISPDPTATSASNADKSIARRVDGAPVRWVLSSPGGLLVGGDSAESIIVPGVSGILTPTEASARVITQRGSDLRQPESIDRSVFFIERGGYRIRQIRFTNEQDFDTIDATILASHLGVQGFRRLAYQQSPYSVLWALDRNGGLFGWTIEGEQEVMGAHRHRLGGAFNGGPPKVLDIATVPVKRTDGSFTDALFLVVNRHINGNQTTYLEKIQDEQLTEDHTDDTPVYQALYAVEAVPYVDAWRRIDPDYIIEDAYVSGGVMVFKYTTTSPVPANGDKIEFRGLRWRKENKIINTGAGDREVFVIKNLNTTNRTFRIAFEATPTIDITPADLNLPATGVVLQPSPNRLRPLAFKRRTGPYTYAATQDGDDLKLVANGVIKASLAANESAGLLYAGFPYKTRFRTMPLHLSSGLVPSDAGEPVVPTRATLRLRAAVAGEISVSSGVDTQDVVIADTTNIMDAPPVPAYKDITVAVGGNWDGDGSILVETDAPYPMEIVGLYVNLKTNPR